MNRAMMLVAAALFALTACEDKKSTEPKTEETASSKNATTTTNSTAVAPGAQAPTQVTIADGDLSTPADFEESAEKAITKASYKTELAALEADIAKDKE